MRLTDKERRFLNRVADIDRDGTVSRRDFLAKVRSLQQPTAEREALLEQRERAHDGSLGMKMIVAVDFLGTTLFAVVGAEAAGQAGMHVVGCTLVGCIAACGGGTLNNLMTGHTPVFWLRDSRFLLAAVVSSIATFYLWPKYESWAARRELQEERALLSTTIYSVMGTGELELKARETNE